MSVLLRRLLFNVYTFRPNLIVSCVTTTRNINSRQFSSLHNQEAKNDEQQQQSHLTTQSLSSADPSPAPTSFVVPDFNTFGKAREILEYLATLENESQMDVGTLEQIILRLRLCLVKEEYVMKRQNILRDFRRSVGMKKLCSLISDKKPSPGSLVDVLGLYVNLRGLSDVHVLKETASTLAACVKTMSLNQVKFIGQQFKAMSKDQQNHEALQGLKLAIEERLEIPYTNQDQLLTYLTKLTDEITVLELEDVILNFEHFLSRNRPTTMKQLNLILTSKGMENLCRLVDREDTVNLPVYSLLKFLQILRILKTPGDHQTLTQVLHLLKSHLDNKFISHKQIKSLGSILYELDAQSRSESSHNLIKAVGQALTVAM